MKLPRGLYLVTPDRDDTEGLLSASAAAIAGGAVCLQYRHKQASDALRLVQARALAALCRERGVCFIVNDHVELALAVGADGIHIGGEDGDAAALRASHGQKLLIGVSCYDDFARAEIAAAVGADYIAFGAMYASPTKPQARQAPIDLITCARQQIGLPVACIGGITADNAAPLVTAGADLLAVISDIYNAADPQVQAARFTTLFQNSPTSRP